MIFSIIKGTLAGPKAAGQTGGGGGVDWHQPSPGSERGLLCPPSYCACAPRLRGWGAEEPDPHGSRPAGQQAGAWETRPQALVPTGPGTRGKRL